MVAHDGWTGPEGQRADRPIHVAPINDLRKHITNGDPCPCMPRTVREVIVHNAYDKREVGEVGRRALYWIGSALAARSHDWSDDEREAFEHLDALLEMHWPTKDGEKLRWPCPDGPWPKDSK